jgi:hypothetical protein
MANQFMEQKQVLSDYFPGAVVQKREMEKYHTLFSVFEWPKDGKLDNTRIERMKLYRQNFWQIIAALKTEKK